MTFLTKITKTIKRSSVSNRRVSSAHNSNNELIPRESLEVAPNDYNITLSTENHEMAPKKYDVILPIEDNKARVVREDEDINAALEWPTKPGIQYPFLEAPVIAIWMPIKNGATARSTKTAKFQRWVHSISVPLV